MRKKCILAKINLPTLRKSRCELALKKPEAKDHSNAHDQCTGKRLAEQDEDRANCDRNDNRLHVRPL